MITLKGAEVSARIKAGIQEELLGWKGQPPRLAIVRVGENPDDMSYERGAVKKMDAFGLRVSTFAFPADIGRDAFCDAFQEINQDPDIHGILLLRPLPKQLKEEEIAALIDPLKDLDGISQINIAKVFSGDESGFAPCTAEAVMEVLKSYDISPEGRRVVIVGRSLVVGKPLAMLMMKANATVTVCHTRTRELEETCRRAEILVAAAGRAGMIGPDHVGEGAVVIDVGINVNAEGRLCGDVDFDRVRTRASMITPVPGGVGTVTTAVLAGHLMRAAKS